LFGRGYHTLEHDARKAGIPYFTAHDIQDRLLRPDRKRLDQATLHRDHPDHDDEAADGRMKSVGPDKSLQSISLLIIPNPQKTAELSLTDA
jgi:hypothetical protein